MMMKKLIFALAIFASGTAAANCFTNTYFINGRMVMCQTCCWAGNCTTTCF
jgi:hypothetical protein